MKIAAFSEPGPLDPIEHRKSRGRLTRYRERPRNAIPGHSTTARIRNGTIFTDVSQQKLDAPALRILYS